MSQTWYNGPMIGNKRAGQSGPKGWWGIGLRLLATLFFLLLLLVLSRCGGQTPTPTAAPTVENATAWLHIEVAPAGAEVWINGERVGITPLSVEGPPGRHTVRVQAEGHEPLERAVTLAPGDEATVSGELVPLAAPPTPTQAAAAASQPTPTAPVSPAESPTIAPPPPTPTAMAAPPPSPTVAAPPTEAPSATAPPPTATPPPPPPPTAPPAAVALREGQTTIAVYPYADFTTDAWSDAFHMSYPVLDRAAYDAANPTPRDATYRTLEVENEYLKLVFLPDLGGRLYEVIYKPTGRRETYRNPVLKPSPWGPPEQGWWLAAGGIEWCLPVEEHGYEWGVPWRISAGQDDRGVTVILRDTAPDAADRLRAEVRVRLAAGDAAFTIRYRLENPTAAPLAVKFWANAMLAPGGRNAPSADLRFILPQAVTEVTVHSRGDDALPGAGQRMSWPLFNGVDYSRLGNWNRWLGFFQDPAQGEFMAVYDGAYDEGMVRAFAAGTVPGAKGFAFGWNDPIPPANWTDDGSGYVELHSGPAPTFDDAVTIPAGGELAWSETWYPVAGMGGLRCANERAALDLRAGGGQAHLAAAVTRPWSGRAVLTLNGQPIWEQAVRLTPGQPFRADAPLGDAAGRLTLTLTADDGAALIACDTDF